MGHGERDELRGLVAGAGCDRGRPPGARLRAPAFSKTEQVGAGAEKPGVSLTGATDVWNVAAALVSEPPSAVPPVASTARTDDRRGARGVGRGRVGEHAAGRDGRLAAGRKQRRAVVGDGERDRLPGLVLPPGGVISWSPRGDRSASPGSSTPDPIAAGGEARGRR